MLDLLRALRDQPGLGTTRLLYAANLSHERLQEYLGDLKTKGLVVETAPSERKTYQLSEPGRKLLIELERIRSFMNDFGLGL